MTEEWVLASEASCRDWSIKPEKLGSNLIEFAAQGLIRTRAAAFTDGAAVPTIDAELPLAFWQVLKSRTGSAYRDWTAGSFRTGVAHSVTNRVAPDAKIALGVKFSAADLDSHFPASRSPWFNPARRNDLTAIPATAPLPAAAVDRRSGGARPKVEEWQRFYLHAMQMLNDGLLGEMSSQAELRRALLAAVGDTLSEDTVKKHVSKIWHVFREGAPIDLEG